MTIDPNQGSSGGVRWEGATSSGGPRKTEGSLGDRKVSSSEGESAGTSGRVGNVARGRMASSSSTSSASSSSSHKVSGEGKGFLAKLSEKVRSLFGKGGMNKSRSAPELRNPETGIYSSFAPTTPPNRSSSAPNLAGEDATGRDQVEVGIYSGFAPTTPPSRSRSNSEVHTLETSKNGDVEVADRDLAKLLTKGRSEGSDRKSMISSSSSDDEEHIYEEIKYPGNDDNVFETSDSSREGSVYATASSEGSYHTVSSEGSYHTASEGGSRTSDEESIYETPDNEGLMQQRMQEVDDGEHVYEEIGESFDPSPSDSPLVAGLKQAIQEGMKTKGWDPASILRDSWVKLEAERPVEYKMLGLGITSQSLEEVRKTAHKQAKGPASNPGLLKQVKTNTRQILDKALVEGNDGGWWDTANIMMMFLLEAGTASNVQELMEEINDTADSDLARLGQDLQALKEKSPRDFNKALENMTNQAQGLISLLQKEIEKANPRYSKGLVESNLNSTQLLFKHMEKQTPTSSLVAKQVMINDMFPPRNE
ncbi:hypothetical protein [Chlamydiifrater volucris]|uniref:hypothetical protein n=1 Tax=Chlamydiifrater volucris TaxID=2681470 RepID=UPI001BCB88CC|nr:hypothetical protein [Chlamydiifrater volucris]